MITAILTSDNHLGANYAKFRPDRLELRRKRLRQAFEQVVDAAIERKADLFLHAGDLFDRPDPRNDERRFVASQLRRLREASIPVFAIAGNHDSPRSYGYGGGVVPQEEADVLGGLRLFRDTAILQSEEVISRGQRVCIWGMSTDFNRPADVCPLEGMTLERADPAALQIVLLHYGVQGWMQTFGDENNEPLLFRCNLERLPVDAICVGHLHRRMQTTLENGALLINPGSTEHMDFGEESLECGFSLLRIERNRTEVEHIRIPTQRMQTLEFTLPSDLRDVLKVEQESEVAAQLMALYQAEISAASHTDQLLRVRFSGQIPRNLFHALDLMELQRLGSAANFHCQVETDRITVFDPDSDLPLGYGVSFDVAEELQNIANGQRGQYNGNPLQQELYDLATNQIMSAFDRLTKGAR